MDMWVPLKESEKNKNKTKKNIKIKCIEERTERRSEERTFKKILYLFISQIYGNLTVGIRRDKHEKCSTGRGLRVGTKNKGFHREFR